MDINLLFYKRSTELGVVVSGLEFVDHGYKDLLVTISPDLPPDNAVAILGNPAIVYLSIIGYILGIVPTFIHIFGYIHHSKPPCTLALI